MEVERRHVRSRGGCWGDAGNVGSALASSAQSKRLETGDFLMFSSFGVKLVVVDRVSSAVTIVAGADDPIEGCDSKKSCKIELLLCPVGCWVGDELAVEGSVEDCKLTSLWLGRLVWTCAMSSVHPTMLGEGVWGVVWVEIHVSSIFSLF